MNSAATLPPAPTRAALPPRTLGGLFDLIAFLASAVGLLLLVQFAALSLLVYNARERYPHLAWGELAKRITESVQYNAFFAVPVQLTYSALVLLLLYALVRGRRGLPFWSSLALAPLRPAHVAAALAAGGLLSLIIQAANLLLPPPEPLAIDRLFSSRAAAWLVIAAGVLVAPFVEELIFRGYIYTLLEQRWGMTSAVLASGLLFGAIHFHQLYPGYFQMVLISVVGLVFSLARARAGTVLASILLHFTYNATLSLLFLLSPQFRNLPAAF